MTKVDERSVVPPLDEEARKRLAKALDRPGVVAASLFGSQASGRAGPLSDVDVAVWVEPGMEPGRRWNLRLALAGAASEALGTGEVDLVVLNDAPPLLQHRAIASSRPLLERDRAARVRLETRAILDYLDTVPLRAELARGRKARLAEDRFGRR